MEFAARERMTGKHRDGLAADAAHQTRGARRAISISQIAKEQSRKAAYSVQCNR